MKLAAAISSLLIAMTSIPALATDSPTSQDPNCLSNCNTDTATVEAHGEKFGITQHRAASDKVPGRGRVTDGEAPGKTTWTHTEEFITPMCSMNGLHGADAMCMGAATYCQDGRVAFW